MSKSKIIYYTDELHDDFGSINIGELDLKLDKNYNFSRGNKFHRFLDKSLYFLIVLPILRTLTYFKGIKVKGKENVKEFKKMCKKQNKGGFIYANHVTNSDVFQIQTRIIPSKYSNIVGFPNMSKKKYLLPLLKALGYLPLGNDFLSQKKLIKEMEFRLNLKENIIIFPEAHIWPYYTNIRPFLDSSFYYPSKFNSPILPIRTLFTKRKFGKKPRRIIVIGKPIIPNPKFDLKENKTYLRDYVYQNMLKLSEGYEIKEYIKYIKVDKNEKEI